MPIWLIALFVLGPTVRDPQQLNGDPQETDTPCVLTRKRG